VTAAAAAAVVAVVVMIGAERSLASPFHSAFSYPQTHHHSLRPTHAHLYRQVLLDPAQFPSILTDPRNMGADAAAASTIVSSAPKSLKRAKREERRRKAASRVHAQVGNKLGELDLGARKVMTTGPEPNCYPSAVSHVGLTRARAVSHTHTR
jgi:hypothetical protein